MVRVYQCRDTLPLNKSFDTAETSDSLYSKDMFPKQPIVIALRLDEKDESQDPVKKIQKEQDEEAMIDNSSVSSVYTSNSLDGGEGIIEREQQDGGTSLTSGLKKNDEAKVAVNSAASLKSNSDEDLDDSSTALWDVVVTASIVAGSQWKEDKPFDEESILEEGAGESVLEFRYPDESLDQVIEITMIADKAGRHTDSFKAAASGKERKRRRMALIAILCCLLLVVAVVIGLMVGTLRNNKQNGGVPAASGLQRSPEDTIGEEDEPAREDYDEEEQLKQIFSATPTAAPTTTPTVAPTITPTVSTSPPSMEPSTGTPVPTVSPSDLPTAPPTTPEPTASPSSSPSSQPTPCMNQLSVDQSCYVQGQAVVTLDFSQCNPQTDDWIGIYVDGANPQALGDNYVDWSWACGSQGCFGTAERNIFRFNSANFALQNFRAYLVRDSPNGAPYGSIATSDVFTVARNCPA
jgi:hypothetical protein